jgi:hypothetical protein
MVSYAGSLGNMADQQLVSSKSSRTPSDEYLMPQNSNHALDQQNVPGSTCLLKNEAAVESTECSQIADSLSCSKTNLQVTDRLSGDSSDNENDHANVTDASTGSLSELKLNSSSDVGCKNFNLEIAASSVSRRKTEYSNDFDYDASNGEFASAPFGFPPVLRKIENLAISVLDGSVAPNDVQRKPSSGACRCFSDAKNRNSQTICHCCDTGSKILHNDCREYEETQKDQSTGK